jgi:hypothetical protein
MSEILRTERLGGWRRMDRDEFFFRTIIYRTYYDYLTRSSVGKDKGWLYIYICMWEVWRRRSGLA